MFLIIHGNKSFPCCSQGSSFWTWAPWNCQQTPHINIISVLVLKPRNKKGTCKSSLYVCRCVCNYSLPAGAKVWISVQFQTWSRMNSKSSLLELSFILAAAGFIACVVTVAKRFSWDRYNVIIFTSHTGNVVPCLEGEFVSTWAVTVILTVNYWGRKQKGAKTATDCLFDQHVTSCIQNLKKRPCLIQDKATTYRNTQFTGSWMPATNSSLCSKGIPYPVWIFSVQVIQTILFGLGPRKLALISSEKWEFWGKVWWYLSVLFRLLFSTSEGGYNT